MVACFLGGLTVCFTVLCSAACCFLGIGECYAPKSDRNAYDAPVSYRFGYIEISDSELSDNELEVNISPIDVFQAFPDSHAHSD